MLWLFNLVYGIGYIATFGFIFQFTARFDDMSPGGLMRTHLAALPLVLGSTALFAWVSGYLSLPILLHGSETIPYGFLAGSLAFIAIIIFKYLLGWVSLPTWGWHAMPMQQVILAILYQIVGHAAIALNEELAYRGYLYGIFVSVFGPGVAAVIVLILFVRFHERIPMTIAYVAIYGTLFMFCRWLTGSIWFGFGAHWAWNVMQTAILGNPDGMPSLRPLRVHGPAWWVGRPGIRGGMISIIAGFVYLIATIAYSWTFIVSHF